MSECENKQQIWDAAKRQLRQYGYKITLKQFEQAWGTDFCDLIQEFDLRSDKVMAVIHEAVEAEEIKRETGNWISPRDYYDEWTRKGVVIIEPHAKAEKIAPIGHRILELAKEHKRI